MRYTERANAQNAPRSREPRISRIHGTVEISVSQGSALLLECAA
jgi:hypothetical protein